MEETNLEFCFKGTRTYVHGTDIFNKLSSQITHEKIIKNIDLSFHGIIRTNMFLTSHKPDDKELIKFIFKYVNFEDIKTTLFGIENNREIECRYEYPEESICQLGELNLENEEIVLKANSSYSFVENSVALNKFLLENLFQGAQGKWYFSRLQLTKIPQENTYPLRLVLKANFNLKLTKTEIFISNESIGFIYFSLV